MIGEKSQLGLEFSYRIARGDERGPTTWSRGFAGKSAAVAAMVCSPSSVDSRARRSCVRSIDKQDSPGHRPCRRCSIHGDMDRVRVAVSIDSGILSPQPSLPRTRVMVVRRRGRWDVCSARFALGELSKSPLVRAVAA